MTTENPQDAASESGEVPTEWTPTTAMARWRELEAQRAEADSVYEAQIEPYASAHSAAIAPLDEERDAIETWFLAHANEVGQQAFESDAGKVTISERETPKLSDADAFFSWAASSNNVGLLQKRLSVTQYREYVKANPDQTPPGVTVEVDQSVKFKAQ